MMNKLQPYLAIDIETTGLDSVNDQILEIAAIYDDGIKPINELLKFRKIHRLSRIIGSPYALHLNTDLLKEIANGQKDELSLRPINDLTKWLDDMFYDTDLEGEPITLAGKNVANFDLKFLLQNGFNYPYKHRIIDVGSLYLTEFGHIPSLDEINTLINRQSVSHKALDDCLDIVHAIRTKFNRE